MDIQIWCVNGTGGVGKTTFENMCQDLSKNSNVLIGVRSTVDLVKEFARTCGWNGAKSEVDRRFLSDLKDALTRWNDVPVKDIFKAYKGLQILCDASGRNGILFVDAREPDELHRFRSEFGAKCLLIRRDCVKTITSNHADADVEKFNYDYIIENNGNEEDLKRLAVKFLTEEGVVFDGTLDY